MRLKRLPQQNLPPAKKSAERPEETVRESCCFVRYSLELLRKRPLLSAVDLARDGRDLVGGEIGFVSGGCRLTACGCELICNRTNHRALDRHGWSQLLGRIMLGGLVHYLNPDGQRKRCAVPMWNDRYRLIKADPNTAGQRARITEEPGVLVIVRGTGLARCGQCEPQRPGARASATR